MNRGGGSGLSSIILYIDDEPAPDGLEAELERRGHSLVETQDPEEVRRLVVGGEPVLVFLEILLAGCDGFDLLESIAAAQPDLPVVVATRGQEAGLYARAVEIGCRDFLTKPVLTSQLLACVFDLAGRAVEQAVDPGKAVDLAAAGGPELSGGAEGLGFAELFQQLHEAGFSGVVTASDAGRRVGVELRNGTPVCVSSSAGRERLEDFLRRRGRITAEQHDAVVDQIAAGVGHVEEVVLGLEILSEDQLRAVRAEQGHELALELFGWPEASQRVLPGKRLKADSTLALEWSAPAIVLAGVLRHAPDEQVDAWLDRSRDLYVSEGARGERDELFLSPELRALVTRFQGDRALAEIIAAGEGEARALYALALTGALDLDESPVLVLSDALEPVEPESEPQPESQPEPEPEPEPEFGEPAPPLAAQAEPETARATPAELAPAPPEPAPRAAPKGILRERVRAPERVAREREIERRMTELTALSEQLAERDDFAILEVREESSDDEVHRAYQARLAFDFLRLPAPLADEPALRDLVKQIRGCYSEAYQHLRTQDGRRVHAALGKSPRSKPAEVERALDAEGWFRKGEAFLNERAYDKALEAFGMATHFDPEQGEYLSHLGYALFLTNPRDELVRREAMENMAKGIKLSPDRPVSYVYLARALKAHDDIRNAKRMLQRALKIDPDCHPALQEQRLLDTRRDKSKKTGLLGRIRRS